MSWWPRSETQSTGSVRRSGIGGMIRGAVWLCERQAARPGLSSWSLPSRRSSPQGTAGAHRVEGVRLWAGPPAAQPGAYDEVRVVTEGDARVTARRLTREEGHLRGHVDGPERPRRA